MITINGQSDSYILDLNASMDNYNELSVRSQTNGTPIKWFISYVSSPLLTVYSFLNNRLGIETNLEELKEDSLIILKNLKKEEIAIIVKPNIEASREKNYIFKLGKNTIDGNEISITIISKENGKTEPWSIVRDGKPLSYDISMTKVKIIIKLNTILDIEFISNFELIQDNSGKKLNFSLKHINNNSVELIENKEAD